MDCSWLNQKKEDIRKYIPVYGIVVRPEREHKPEKPPSVKPLRQASITFKLSNSPKKKQSEAQKRVPAFVFSKGVRKKVETKNNDSSEDNETFDNKENLNSHVNLDAATWQVRRKRGDICIDSERDSKPKKAKVESPHHHSVTCTRSPDIKHTSQRTIARDMVFERQLSISSSSELDNTNSDLFIDTNELLADLSNCEKM